tara:strand:+ start:10554 stop:11021 length:468 start_codon:yes stop_codon:yes gene_type:complete
MCAEKHLSKEKKMSKIMLFGQNSEEVAVPASEMLVKTAGFDVINDELCFVFASSEGKRGYGKQAIPVSNLEESYAVLKDLAENGVVPDDYTPTTAEIIKQSIVLNSEDGSVRFKTQGDKGKKPTYFMSETDFQGFVKKLGDILPAIMTKIDSIKS